MINLAKTLDFFNPTKIDGRVHIIGCGSVGSELADQLARYGVTKISLYDFDIVTSHNIANQRFYHRHINKEKTAALKEILCDINPDIEDTLQIHGKYTDQQLSGYVFLCLDNIDRRREIVEKNMQNPYIKAVFDVRTRLEDAQHYAAIWNSTEQKKDLLNSMQFSHEEAMAETPVSACNLELSAISTIRSIVSREICNFINHINGKTIHRVTLDFPFDFYVDAYK